MPARLYEPLVAAACEEKNGRSAVAGRRRQAEALDGHVEIEVVDARAVLHRIDQPQRRSMPSVPRFLMKGMWCGWNDGSSSRNSIVKRSPFGISRLPSLIDVARLLQQLRGLAQQRAVLARAVGHRRHERLAEHLVRHLAAERLEQRKFFRRRLAVAIMSEFWNGDSALIGAVHDGLVGPFEIEGVDQRLAQRGP